MNLRICKKSTDGRHNFVTPGSNCFNGCGINQNDLSNRPVRKEVDPLDRIAKRIKKGTKFTSERQMWIQETADMLRVPFTVVLYKTIRWDMVRVRDHYLQAKKQSNPGKYWWGIIKYQKAQKVMNSPT